ncbi:MAG: transcriptional regulator [Candidatus Woesearchaeota archaeon]
MKLPQEIELWYVIPMIRKELVIELKKHNLKQNDIAARLGITSPAVSQYMKDKRAACCHDAFQQDMLKSEIRKAAQKIAATKTPEPAIAMKELNRICQVVKNNNILCEIHKQKDPSLRDCEACHHG